MARSSGDSPLRTLLMASLPGWLLALVAAVLVYRATDVPFWALLTLTLAWIAIDLATFPRRRRFFVSEPSSRRIVGERGVAASELSPRGFVRVHGELWQARVAPGTTLHEGDELRVRDIEGLELTVEPLR